MVTGTSLSKDDGDPFANATQFHTIVGALQYNTLNHQKGTLDYDILLITSNTLGLTTYTDTDWALCVDDRRSTSRYCIYLGQYLISWSSGKQIVVSRFNTEAKF